MEELLKQILSEIKNLKAGQNDLKEEISTIKSDMATKTQQDENSGYIKSLLHCTEEMSAQFDGLLHTTVTKEAIANLASKEDINKLNAKFEVLNSRLFHQEAELYELKAVK